MTDNQVEQEIQIKGLTAPRITPADIEANIASEHYFTAKQGAYAAGYYVEEDVSLGLLTFCVLRLKTASPSPARAHAPARRTSTPSWAARSPVRTRWPKCGR